MKKFILVTLLFSTITVYGQVAFFAGDELSTILHIEVRDYNDDQGCTGNADGWTCYTWWNDFTEFKDSSLHCDNGGYNDSGASAVIGNTQYQVNCICKTDNPINMFIKNYTTQVVIDSLIIYSDQIGHTTHRLTLLGICKLPNNDSLLLGGYERYNNPPTITHPDTMYGFWKWLPNDTSATWCYNTEVSGSYAMNGLAVHGNYVYSVSERTDTLEVVDVTTWTQVNVVDMGQPGGCFRGIAIIDNTVLIGNQTDATIDYYNLSTLTYISSRDMSDFVDTGNILYGLWTKQENRY